MKNILVLHTGGTISMSENDYGAVDTNSSNPLMKQANLSGEDFHVTSKEFMNLPSPHMTPETMLTLQQEIKQEYEKFDGFVITHGTDTLEETAYFLDLTLNSSKPIVVTGAMRSSNSIGSDGLHNLISAIRIAINNESRNRGVLVALNDQIHAARFVTKAHTTNVETFESPSVGPIGEVLHDTIAYYFNPKPIAPIQINQVVQQVYLLKAYAGMDADLFNHVAKKSGNGLVIEGTGAGNLPPTVLQALQKVIDHQIPVFLVARGYRGNAEPVYTYEGGGEQLVKMGVNFVHGLNGQKARIKLLIGISAGLSNDGLKEYLSNNF